MKQKRKLISIISLFLVMTLTISLCGCNEKDYKKAAKMSRQTGDLMKGVKAQSVSGRTADKAFELSQTELALKLFQASLEESKEENVLVSPLSIQLALAMTANGAAGTTKEEMERLLGGKLSLEELNEYLYRYVQDLTSENKKTLKIANSIWFRDDKEKLKIAEDFLQKNADYYGAQAYKAPFNQQTVKDINGWVKKNTDGMIGKIVDEIQDESIMFLINALAFEAEWQDVYNKEDIYDDFFNPASGKKQKVEMMHSTEYTYLEDEKATGFVKPYKGNRYSFAALLPKEGVSVSDYVQSLTAEGLKKTLDQSQEEDVVVCLPKFSYEFDWTMKDALDNMGMSTAFDVKHADFSKMGTSEFGNIYIGNVLHKTFISVDELGTKAGAVTVVNMMCGSALVERKEVILNRPFVYMILDSKTNLPVFIGTVMNVK